MALTTVCYIRNQDKILMLHRIKEENDFNKGKWLGVGGHVELGESPHEAVRREILEESGLEINEVFFQGIITFDYEGKDTDYIFVFRAKTEEVQIKLTSEGVLKWIEAEQVMNLNIWEGDKIFLPLVLEESEEVFHVKFRYNSSDELLDYKFE